MEREITLTIDDKKVTVPLGTTVLEAARLADIDIPTICDHPALKPYGACRMCIVQIEGVRGFPTSCTTPAADSMIVRTRTEEVITLRKRTLELMMSGHPNACLVCDYRDECEKHKPAPSKAGTSTRCGLCSNRSACEVRELALGDRSSELNLTTIYSSKNLERYDPFITRDHNLCILCGRCWRICEEIHGKPAISIVHRGKQARIGTSFDMSWVDSGCTFCGACVDICPTGTITDTYARWRGVPDGEYLSVCSLCPTGCLMRIHVSAGKIVSVSSPTFRREDRLCAVGRFVYAQLTSVQDRLAKPVIMKDGEQVPVSWEEAVEALVQKLGTYRNKNEFVVITDRSQPLENLYAYQHFVESVMRGKAVILPHSADQAHPALKEICEEILEGKIKGAWLAGNYLPQNVSEKLECLIVADFVTTPIAEKASAVLPVQILNELGGSFMNAEGATGESAVCVASPKEAWPEKRILGELEKILGEETSGVEVQALEPPQPFEGNPRDTIRELPKNFRGHCLSDHIPSLEAMGYERTALAKRPQEVKEGFQVISNTEVAPNFHLVKIKAPAIAEHAKAGQFVIVMLNETAERVPYTLSDWSAEEGTVTIVVEEVGRSSRGIGWIQAGQKIAHISGPLGLPLKIENIGTVVLGGGCYGIGAIYPLAKAFKEAGNRVICVLEASSHFLFYMEDKIRSVSDELYFVSRDGSKGIKGGVHNIFVSCCEQGVKVGMFVAVGCTLMMKLVDEATRKYEKIPLYVALNPIMVDGTGMCGACRISIGSETKFACVDGPFFDGHKVHWEELASRRTAYTREEVDALSEGFGFAQGRSVNLNKHACACGEHS